MATRTAAPSRIPRPIPGPAAAPASTRRDYTQPPPGGAHYPWEPGGGSKIPGVPDNWSDFYPNEGEGRGDAWIGPKKAQLNAEHPPSSYQGVKSARDQFAGDPQGFANWQHKNAAWGGDDPHKFYPGDPEPTSAQRAAADKLPLENALRMHGVKPGPLNKIGGTPGDAGYYNGKTVTPPATPGAPTGKTAGKTQAPATNDQLGKWFGTMKPGSTMNIQGKTYFKNMNGAVVDKTNPAAAKRITDRAGAFIGQAAAPPPPGAPATAQAAIAPTAAPAAAPAAGGVDPQQFADMQQQFQQMQQQLQQYQQGGGGYGNAQMTGNEMGYGGMPQQFSGFGNAIMQGMGGGYGNSLMQMPSDYAMAQGMGGMGGGGYGDPYGGMGGYGMPQQFSQGMMGGYGGDIGDPYGMGNQMIQGAMGGYGQGMDQMMGYNAGMGGYGAPGMGYY